MWPFSRTLRGDEASLEFVLVAEKGILERQALLLCESIRRFGGKYSRCAITVASPRPSRRPSAQTLAQLDRMACTYLPLEADSVEPEYGTTFRMYVSAELERISNAEILVVMDSDLLFCREPDLALNGCSAALRPVDAKGICTAGNGDPRDGYWQALCDVLGVDYDAIPMVETTAGGISVKASYNGGLAVVKRRLGIFERTLRYFQLSVAAGLLPSPGTDNKVNAGHGLVSGRASELWGSSQACLSLAIWGSGLSVRTLPRSHNFPLHMYAGLQRAERKIPLSIIHYHDLFDRDPALNPALNGSANVSLKFSRWIRSKALAQNHAVSPQ